MNTRADDLKGIDAFIYGSGIVGWAMVTVVTISFLVTSCCTTGNHLTTEVYPICSRGAIEFRAVTSPAYDADQKIEMLIHGKPVMRRRLSDETWERLASAMREKDGGK